MPTELTLLSDREPDLEDLVRSGAIDHPEGSLVSYLDGTVKQFVDAEGIAVLQVFRSRRAPAAAALADVLHDPPSQEHELWTDLTIAYGDPSAGRALAEKVAAAVDGSVHERI